MQTRAHCSRGSIASLAMGCVPGTFTTAGLGLCMCCFLCLECFLKLQNATTSYRNVNQKWAEAPVLFTAVSWCLAPASRRLPEEVLNKHRPDESLWALRGSFP